MAPTKTEQTGSLETKAGRLKDCPSTHCLMLTSFKDHFHHDVMIETAHLDANDQQALPIEYDPNGNPLDPQPSADPHDPLNLPQWQKWGLIAALSYWAFLGTMNLIIVVRITSVWSLES